MLTNTEPLLADSFFRDQFEESRGYFHKESPAVLNAPREEAFRRFMSTGLPGTRTEAYRYTDLSKALKPGFQHLVTAKPILFAVEDIFRCDVPNLDTDLILLVNGFFHGEQRLVVHPDGMISGSLHQAALERPDLVAPWYNHLAGPLGDPIAQLNTALATDGLFLYLPEGIKRDRPVQVINLLLNDEALMARHRNLVVLGANSSLRLVICDHSLSPQDFFTHSVYEFFAGPDASLDLIRMQNESNQAAQVSSSFFHQESNSRVSSNTITLHGGFVRNNFIVNLAGEGAENRTLGLFLADKNQHISNFTLVDHLAPHCTSNQQFKGVLDDDATGSFNGKIMVRRDSQQTLAYQSNKNLLLTDRASMQTKPQLEIYADDVKCSHGATVGQLDENAMFYLRSRGIPLHEARLLMMFGFAHEIINQIAIQPLRERIDHLVDLRLRGELSRCHNCPMNCC